MTTTTIACIGSGNMGFALMKGIAKGTMPAGIGKAVIGFADSDKAKAKTAAAALGAAVYSSNIKAAEKGDYIFLAVKPQVLAQVLTEIAPVLYKQVRAGRTPVLVSMAAGWPITVIQDVVKDSYMLAPKERIPVARIMPNTPALVSKGLIVLACSPGVGAEKAAVLEMMLKGAGTVDRLNEDYFDAVTALSGSSPAFAYMFIEALADGGVLAGLPRDKAQRFAAQTMLGAAAMVLETGRHPGELKDMVASPSGTTIAGIAALEAGAFRSTVMKAVEAAWRRSSEL